MRTALFAVLMATAMPALSHAQDRTIAEAVADVAGRGEANVAMDANRHPAEMLDFLGLRSGMDVLDIAGTNLYWTEIMAPVVGETGSVVVWSPLQFLDEKGRGALAAYAAGHERVVPIASRFETPLVGTGRYDFVLVNLDYHDAYWESEKFGIERMEPRAWAKTLYDAMAPGGVLGIADHRAQAGADPRASVEAAHRIDPAVVKADMEAVGFVLEAESDLLANPEDDRTMNVFNPAIRGKTDRFLMRFRKPA